MLQPLFTRTANDTCCHGAKPLAAIRPRSQWISTSLKLWLLHHSPCCTKRACDTDVSQLRKTANQEKVSKKSPDHGRICAFLAAYPPCCMPQIPPKLRYLLYSAITPSCILGQQSAFVPWGPLCDGSFSPLSWLVCTKPS